MAAHIGHLFAGNGDGTLFAYNVLKRGALSWSRQVLNSTTIQKSGTVDIVPIVINDDENGRQVLFGSCQELSPHHCALAVFKEDGELVWNSEHPHSLPSESHGVEKGEKNEKNGKREIMSVNDIDWNGRIHQPIPADDGDLIIVPMCPRLTINMQNECRIYAIDPMTATVKWQTKIGGILRGDLLLTRSGELLVPMCDFATFKRSAQCLRVFLGLEVEDGTILWSRNWNASQMPIFYNSHSNTHIAGSPQTPKGKEFPKIGPFGLQMSSQFTGIVADGAFVTIADDMDDQTWAVGTDMASGNITFLTKIQGGHSSRRFVGCAAMPVASKARQLFFMTSQVIFSLDTTGALIWKNTNSSNLVRSMSIDTGGALYVATSRKSAREYFSTLDVYDAEGGRYSYSLPIHQCVGDSPLNMTIVPHFVLTTERTALVMCKGKLYAIYSSAVPFWAWITLSIFFAFVLIAIFIIGFLYHRRQKRKFEEIVY